MDRTAAALTLGLVLVACGPSDADDPADAGPPAPGTLVGQILLPLEGVYAEAEASPMAAEVQTARAALARTPAPGGPLPGEEHMAGQVLVRLRGQGAEALRELEDALPDHRLRARTWVAPDQVLVELEDRKGRGPPDHAATLVARDVLARHPAVAGCDPNLLRWPLRTPTDPLFPEQWALPLIQMEGAWDVTVGDASVVLAVLDDGLNDHPDLADRTLPGYDMVSDLIFAGDGDGRDPLPEQVVGAYDGFSAWHGMHVAGIAAATGDNDESIAGVDWRAAVLPVRVLGVAVPDRGAGTSADIVAGIRWAVGAEVPGVPTNPHPARVLNLSLGGGGLSSAEQAAIDEARARGATVVVAAGNEGRDAGRSSMGGYKGVVTVGAAGPDGQRAAYSNFGDKIDVMAPGGSGYHDADEDGIPDGILSLWQDDAGIEPGTAYLLGTSMAAPHVAGVVALMLAVNPELTPEAVEAILEATADPRGRCPEGCGAGLLNGAAAVRRAAGDTSSGGPPSLLATESRVDLLDADSQDVYLYNAGGEVLAWEATSDHPSLALSRHSGELLEAGSARLSLWLDREGLAPGPHEATVTVLSNGGEVRLPVTWWVGPVRPIDVGTVHVWGVLLDGDGSETRTAVTALGLEYRYELSLPAGQWLVWAFADPDGDGRPDYEGTLPRLVQVRAGARDAEGDFALEPVTP